jgi:hypothetical protein
VATTHVFVVDNATFRSHLEHMFAGTGAKDYSVDFNEQRVTALSHMRENLLVAMIADSLRVRIGDYVLFYLQQNFQQNVREGKFYGIFRVSEAPSFLDHNDAQQYLATQLGKSLTFRTLIEPLQVYAHGVTEWEALDEIRNIQSPNQMLWSLIYRKLKGNRGNTMITIYESERLRYLIRDKNDRRVIEATSFSFDLADQVIIPHPNRSPYRGRKEAINVLPRLIEKFGRNTQFESHLQAYIIQNIENIGIFDDETIEWLGNEVSCGVGMQRIDIMLSAERAARTIIPIELKSTVAAVGITTQIQRYVDWIQQYYLANRPSDIEPMLISRQILDRESNAYHLLVAEFNDFNRRNGILPLRYVEFSVDTICGTISFDEIDYL